MIPTARVAMILLAAGFLLAENQALNLPNVDFIREQALRLQENAQLQVENIQKQVAENLKASNQLRQELHSTHLTTNGNGNQLLVNGDGYNATIVQSVSNRQGRSYRIATNNEIIDNGFYHKLRIYDEKSNIFKEFHYSVSLNDSNEMIRFG